MPVVDALHMVNRDAVFFGDFNSAKARLAKLEDPQVIGWLQFRRERIALASSEADARNNALRYAHLFCDFRKAQAPVSQADDLAVACFFAHAFPPLIAFN